MRKKENDPEYLSKLQSLSEYQAMTVQVSPPHSSKDAYQSMDDMEITNEQGAKTFTLKSVYDQIGGFGRFQYLAMITFSFVQFFGKFTIYMFGMATEPQGLVCADDLDSGL